IGMEVEAQFGREPDGPGHAQAILGEPGLWIADRSDPPRGEVVASADVVDDLAGLGIVEEAVDREIAAGNVLLRRCEPDRSGVAPVDVWPFRPKRRHLVSALGPANADHPAGGPHPD